jgi:hypothetical protein
VVHQPPNPTQPSSQKQVDRLTFQGSWGLLEDHTTDGPLRLDFQEALVPNYVYMSKPENPPKIPIPAKPKSNPMAQLSSSLEPN